MEPIKEKFIKQIRIKFAGKDAPYRHMNPYKLLNELNLAVTGKHQMEFVSVKYLMTKNKIHKQLNEIVYSEKEFSIDKNMNNIFNFDHPEEQNSMINFIFRDAIDLKPPTDYDPSTHEKKIQSEREAEENKKLHQHQGVVKNIMEVFLGAKKQLKLNSFESFTMIHHKDDYSQGQYEVYCRAYLSEPVMEKIKNLQLIINNSRLFLHPSNLNPQKQSILQKQYRITDWTLSSKLNDEFVDYFGTPQLMKKATSINNSIKLKNWISFKENRQSTDGFFLTSQLWNETFLRINVRKAQIAKIERATEKISDTETVQEYYFYLTYPVRYYVTVLKKDEALSEKYPKVWERVDNFIFFQEEYIKNNDMLRFYLFNNTIVKVVVTEDKELTYSTTEAKQKIINMIESLKNVDCIKLQKRYSSKARLKSFVRNFNYENFLKKLMHADLELKDLIWKIKYLIMVLFRYNRLLPSEITDIISFIDENVTKKDLQYFLFILWKIATNVWGYKKQQQLFIHIKQQFEEIRKLAPKNIMNRLSINTELIVYIFRLSLTPSGYMFDAPTPQMKGRLLKYYQNQAQFFLRVAIQEQSSNDLKNQKYITKMLFRNQMNSIKILDRQYIPLGWSPSQLRSSSLWYVHEFDEDRGPFQKVKRSQILSFLGSFDFIENPAKRAARIGQSFSASWTFNAKEIQCKQIPEEYSQNQYMYTDGIGKISENLLEEISLKLSLRKLSVIQIRYQGAKGVLVLNPQLPENTIQLRPSMIKYKCLDPDAKQYLDILDWNKYKSGFLNRQIIILLRTLGIEDSVFLKLQDEHIKEIASMTFKDCSIFQNMTDDINTEINDLQPANRTMLNLIKAGFQLENQPFFRGVLETMKKNGYHQLKMKSSIRVAKSARIIGIIDEYGVLEEDQIYCAVYDPFAAKIDSKNEDSNLGFVVNGPAIITRNPCLDPADIRKVNCICAEEMLKRFKKKDFQENLFQPFVNTVIFPMKGKFPLTAQISGSDLDGDNFFVCWDDRLIPKSVSPPNLIDQASVGQSKKEEKKFDINYKQMLDFFIDYVNYEKLGQIDNSHLIHADKSASFANCVQCKQLAKIHGKAVDFPKTGYCPPVPPDLICSEYPTFMEKENAQSTYESQSILGYLYKIIKQKIQSLLEDEVYKGVQEIDNDLIIGFQEFQYDLDDVIRCIKVLQEYERSLSNLINLINVDSQYEIYSGNFSTSKDKVKAFGKNRLVSAILSLREKFANAFFENYDPDYEKYRNSNYKHMNSSNFFSKEIQQKAQLYYLVSYMYKFPKLNTEKPFLTQLRKQINEGLAKLKVMNKDGQYCGFVWFIIPKLIINLKITTRAMKEQEEKGEEANQMEQNLSDHDDGQLE